MDFDWQVWPLVGGFGRYTRLVAAATWLPSLALALGFFSEGLYTTRPVYQCPGATGVTRELCNSTAAPPGNHSDSCPTGWRYDTQGWLENNIITQWDLVCANQWRVPLEHICNLTGMLFGYILFGLICDRWGRRAALISTLVTAVPLGLALSFSPGYLSFVVLRAGFSAALAGMFLSFYIARLELCTPCHRLMVTMIGGFFWAAGELLLPGLAFLCSDWRLLQGVVTGTLMLLGLFWCCHSLFPESPRWLLATQQLERCKESLCVFARANGVELSEEFSGPGSLFAEIDASCEGYPRPRYYSICSIFGTRLIWKNALILGFTTFIGCGIRPCFVRNLQTLGPYIPYFLQAGSEILACILLCITVNLWGRRSVLFLCTILTGFCSLLLLALTQYLFIGATVAISVLGFLCAHAVVMLSIFYASEVLPTVLRGSGLGFIIGLSMVGRAAYPIMELQQKAGFFLHHVVLSSFCIISVLSILLLPETKRKSLPETLRQGDSLRRPPLIIHPKQDSVPLLRHSNKARTDYNPDSYARLASSTKKMITRDRVATKKGKENQALTKD
ncbi:solute carrier family 22 member 31 [Pelobates cultripes]|uniref:Solute carrier family 22 member 31 n=2 Tax=Pelobates cultripes TaxID=61616 RepID=A0AAD1TCY1_PELCU|nr:solute carrier family 22 member 31 [Pelobates cultripes]